MRAAVREVLAGGAAASFVFIDALPTALACFAVSTVTEFFFYKRCAQPRQLNILATALPSPAVSHLTDSNVMESGLNCYSEY